MIMKYDNKKIEEILIEFIKNETHKIGISKAVIGLSGGIDSAVSAFLSVNALGNENVSGIMMPYKSSSKESLIDAGKVADILKIKSKVVDITEIVDSCINKFGTDLSKIRKGNIMARIRMIILYDESAKENALVMGTGNRTEILLGYTTIFGDSACAINPVGDLYKTQLRSLAGYLGVPEEIINKKPSADLWSGQTDEDELGFSYEEVDKYLYLKIDEKKSDEELLELGFKEDFMKRVNNLMIKNEYKSHPPAIAKISDRAIIAD